MKAFCVVIMKPLVLSRCPLPSGSCTWQHQQTNHCKYSSELENSVEAHASSIGADLPRSTELAAIEQRLTETIRNEI